MTVDRSNRCGTSVKKPFTVPLALHRVSPLVGTPIIRCKKSPVAFSFLERATLFVKEGTSSVNAMRQRLKRRKGNAVFGHRLQHLLLQALLADQNHALQGFEKCRLVPIGEACERLCLRNNDMTKKYKNRRKSSVFLVRILLYCANEYFANLSFF
jgi:hypothetical protein